MDLNPNGVEGVRLGPVKGFGTGFGATSNDGGQAVRSGDLTAVLSARVVAIDAAGNARIQGGKTVNVDGRLQQVSIEGYVRPDDVTSDNLVSSARIAEATILYKGKKIGPRQGILGKILSILWP
jgi:flagellar L-ring protein precursor FlgH